MYAFTLERPATVQDAAKLAASGSKPLGVVDFDMPATPGRVWEAIQSAKH